MRLVRSPLRISFVGGGSDLPSHYEAHGGAVVSTTINKYIYISSKPNTSLFKNRFRLIYSQIEECDLPEEIKHPIIKRLVLDYGLRNLDLDVMSDVPAGTGLGSSSAFTVGLHAAMGAMRWGSKYELGHLACKTEIVDLKEPIGKQDQYAAAFGGLNYITFSAERTVVNPILLDPEQLQRLERSLILVHAGGTRSASQMLSEQRQDPKALKRMAGLAKSLHKEFSRGIIDSVGYFVREGWELKKSLSPNATNERIDAIIATAIKNGAAGGKLLGAGGAGFVLLCCKQHGRPNVLNALEEMKLGYTDFSLEKEGCKVLYER